MSTLDWKLLRSVALAGVFTGLSGLTALVPVSAAAQSAVVRGLPDFTELVELAGPSVVNIRTVEKVRQGARSGSQEEQMLEFFNRHIGGEVEVGKTERTAAAN